MIDFSQLDSPFDFVNSIKHSLTEKMLLKIPKLEESVGERLHVSLNAEKFKLLLEDVESSEFHVEGNLDFIEFLKSIRDEIRTVRIVFPNHVVVIDGKNLIYFKELADDPELYNDYICDMKEDMDENNPEDFADCVNDLSDDIELDDVGDDNTLNESVIIVRRIRNGQVQRKKINTRPGYKLKNGRAVPESSKEKRNRRRGARRALRKRRMHRARINRQMKKSLAKRKRLIR